jgi:hypothetical protein
MTIGEIVEQGFHYTRTCRSLWLFGFFVGIASGGSNGGGRGDGPAGAGAGAAMAGGFFELPVSAFVLIAVVIFLAIAALIVMRFVGEGALIEGVVRARRGAPMTTGDGFRAGVAHWGVLFRIALIFFAATIASLVLLVVPCVIAMKTIGPLGAVLLAVPALVVAVPWLVTLYLVQAFAWRIAVLENRRAVDAIAKARLFLHGRLAHGLKVLVASLLGTLAIVLLGLAVIVPVALVAVALMPVIRIVPALVLGGVVLVPVICLLSAVLGTYRSSVWTIGYVTQVES